MVLNKDFVITLIAVISFAGLGALIRTTLSVLIAPFNFFSFIPNIVGSLILGITKGSGLKNKYINKGIGTGLCGSITTFSSFNYELNILIISSNPNIPLAIAFIALTFCLSAVAFYIGETISKYISDKLIASSDGKTYIPTQTQTQTDQRTNAMETVDANPTNIEMSRNSKETNSETVPDTVTLHQNLNEVQSDKVDVTIDSKDREQVTELNVSKEDLLWKLIWKWVIFFVAMNSIVVPLCFMIDGRLWLASVFAPFGAFCRWYLGLRFNKKSDRFFGIPIGTLMANVMGSLILTVVIVMSTESEDPRQETIWVEAITKGFCGCFSTVSSFVGELFALQRNAHKTKENGNGTGCIDQIKTCKVSVIYFFVTVIIAQILSAIPNGISVWG